jgi:hypothetical protein
MTRSLMEMAHGPAAEARRRKALLTERERLREYTRAALALEAAERGDVAEAVPPAPVGVAPVTRAEMAAVKDEILNAVADMVAAKGQRNGHTGNAGRAGA